MLECAALSPWNGSVTEDLRSDKDIPVGDRLIFAMDVPDPGPARDLAEQLGDSVSFYKLGMELFMAGGYSTGSPPAATRSSWT